MPWKREGFFETERQEEIARAKIMAAVKIAAIVYALFLALYYLKNYLGE